VKTVVSNSTFDHGSLSPTYIEPFDVFANVGKLEIGSPHCTRTRRHFSASDSVQPADQWVRTDENLGTNYFALQSAMARSLRGMDSHRRSRSPHVLPERHGLRRWPELLSRSRWTLRPASAATCTRPGRIAIRVNSRSLNRAWCTPATSHSECARNADRPSVSSVSGERDGSSFFHQSQRRRSSSHSAFQLYRQAQNQ
jgi:hypothetical protein